MSFTINLMNLIAGAPSLIDRLTTLVRRDGSAGPGPITRSHPGQSPPSGRRGLWSERLRIESIRPTDLSPHLRRDIGLDF